MALETKVLDLTTAPIDLVADADVAAALTAAGGPIRIAFQNTGINKSVFYADRATAPAAGSRDGLKLGYGDAVVYEIEATDHLWAWSTTTGTLAITGAGEGG